MSAQVNQMFGRFQKTGLKLFTESTKALSNPTVQYAIGAILVLYITFLESETESILSVAMTNPLGRLLVLLLLLLLVSVSVPLGILFAILIVMSCANRENFESVPVHNFVMPASFQDNEAEAKETSPAEDAEKSEDDKSFEEHFLANHGMSPSLKTEEFQVPEPANGNTMEKQTDDDEVKGFNSETTHSLF